MDGGAGASSTAFDHAWELLQRFEGGARIVDDPNDPGGLTKWGISQRAFPGTDIAALTEDQARALAIQEYWIKAGCDRMPRCFAIVVFDAAFNQGVRTAINCLQLALQITQDGIPGQETLRATSRTYPPETMFRFLAARAVWYAMGNPRFRFGWFIRLFRLLWSVRGFLS